MWSFQNNTREKVGTCQGVTIQADFRMYVFLKWGAEKQVSRSFPEMRRKLLFKRFASCGTCGNHKKKTCSPNGLLEANPPNCTRVWYILMVDEP